MKHLSAVSTPATTRRAFRRPIAATGLAAAVIAGGGAAFWMTNPSTEQEQSAAHVQQATIQLSDLTTTERLAGTVEQVDSLTVVHRSADGETSDVGGGSTAAGTLAAAESGQSGVDGEAGSVEEVSLPASDSAPRAIIRVALLTGDPDPTTTTTDGSTTTTPSSTGLGSSSSSAPTATAPPTTTTTAPCQPTTTTSTTEASTTTSTTEPTTSTSGDCADPATSIPPTSTTRPAGDIPDGQGRQGDRGVISRPDSATGGGTDPATSGGAAQTTPVTVTGLAAAGSWIDLGDVIYTADGSPVVALRGSVPAWRSLSTDSEDGVDIRQLEESLVELGYDPDGDISVDETFTSATAEAVAAWQKGLDLPATGTVELGTMVFLPQAVEVTGHSTATGSGVADGDPVLTVAAASRQVVAEVPDDLLTTIEAGLVVDIETDSGEATGVVAFLRAATVDDGTGATSVVVEAVVTPRELLADAVPGAEADVTITVEGEPSVLTVPTEAVASRLDGSYAVQLVGPDSQATWVPVDIVATSGQQTAIRGAGIEAGATVLEPQ